MVFVHKVIYLYKFKPSMVDEVGKPLIDMS